MVVVQREISHRSLCECGMLRLHLPQLLLLLSVATGSREGLIPPELFEERSWTEAATKAVLSLAAPASCMRVSLDASDAAHDLLRHLHGLSPSPVTACSLAVLLDATALASCPGPVVAMARAPLPAAPPPLPPEEDAPLLLVEVQGAAQPQPAPPPPPPPLLPRRVALLRVSREGVKLQAAATTSVAGWAAAAAAAAALAAAAGGGGVPRRWAREVVMEPAALREAWRRWPDLRGRQIVLATIHMAPFTFLEDSTLEGLEANVLVAAARAWGARVRVWRPAADDHPIGVWNESLRAYQGGVLGALSSGAAHAAGALIFRSAEHRGRVAGGRPWGALCTTWLAPRPAPLAPGAVSAAALRRPLSPSVWAADAAALLLAAAALAALRRAGSQRSRALACAGRAALDAFGMLVQTHSPPTLGRPAAQRLFLQSWSLFCVLMVTAYCSSLVAHLTSPQFSPPLDTIQDMVRARVYWGGLTRPPLEEMFYFEEPAQKSFCDSYTLESDNTTRDRDLRLAQRNYAIFGFKLGEAFLPLGPPLSEAQLAALRVVRECARRSLVALMLPLGSPLRAPLDRAAAALQEAGVAAFWRRDVVRRRMGVATQHLLALAAAGTGAGEEPDDDDRRVALAMRHLGGVFALLGLGLGVALAACGCERLRWTRSGRFERTREVKAFKRRRGERLERAWF